MSIPTDHHFLPVFYLKRWCNADGKVIRYHRPHKDVVAHATSPIRTGYEPHLYTLRGNPPGQQHHLETAFMAKEVDTPAAEALTFILANKGQNMTIEHRRHWTRFLLSMHWRNPTALEAVTIEARKFITKNFNNNPEEYRAVRQPGDPPTLLEWQELNRPYDMDDAGRHMLKPLILDDRSGTDIMNMRWATIDLSASSISLLTCDRPFHNGRGIKHPDTVVSLPISPSKLFIATNTEKVEREIDRVGPTDVAVRRNRDTVALAVKHVYGNTDGHLRFVENRLRQTRSSPKNA